MAIAVEIVDEKRLGRIRMRCIPDVSADAIERFVTEVAQPGSSVLTDGWSGYSGLPDLGYDHVVMKKSASPHPAHVLMPGVHRVASPVKRWLLDTYQGAVSNEHLNYYLDEFTFRFNRRRSRSRGLLFYRLLEQAVQTEPTLWREVPGRLSPSLRLTGNHKILGSVERIKYPFTTKETQSVSPHSLSGRSRYSCTPRAYNSSVSGTISTAGSCSIACSNRTAAAR